LEETLIHVVKNIISQVTQQKWHASTNFPIENKLCILWNYIL